MFFSFEREKSHTTHCLLAPTSLYAINTAESKYTFYLFVIYWLRSFISSTQSSTQSNSILITSAWGNEWPPKSFVSRSIVIRNENNKLHIESFKHAGPQKFDIFDFPIKTFLACLAFNRWSKEMKTLCAKAKFMKRVEWNELTLILISAETHKMVHVPGLGGPASGKKKTLKRKKRKWGLDMKQHFKRATKLRI